MEVAGIVFHQVLVMFLLLVTGIIAFKRGIVTLEAAQVFCGFLLKVVIPCVLIDAYRQPFSWEKAVRLLMAFGLSVGFHFFAILLSGLLYKKDEERARIKRLGIIYANSGFMGFPLLNALFGVEGVFLGTAFFATFNVFIWIHGVKALKKGERIRVKSILLNPGTIAMVIGFLTFFLQIPYPRPLGEAIRFLGSMNTPLAMVVTGVFLAMVSLKKTVKEVDFILAALVRTLALPILFVIILFLLRFHTWSEGARQACLVIGICASCPTAAAIVLLPASLHMDGTQGGKILAVSTLFSIVTLPLMTFLIHALLT